MLFGERSVRIEDSFNKFPSIGSFASLKKYMNHEISDGNNPRKVYRGKIKLHGSNIGVTRMPDGSIHAQSRNQVITPDDDHHGFAQFVKNHESFFTALFDNAISNGLDASLKITLFGEWAGKGIQKKVAISEVDRFFAIFSLYNGLREEGTFYVDPDDIKSLIGFTDSVENIYILPWQTCEYVLDFSDDKQLVASINDINKVVRECEQVDPWAKDTFGIEGCGEGYVFYDVNNLVCSRDDHKYTVMKCKGEAHRVNKSKEAIVISPEELSTRSEFADMTVTEARLEQMFSEACNCQYDIKLLGKFIGFVGKDIKKDIDNGLIDLPENLEWKSASKEISNRARSWYVKNMHKCS